tara:strand:+ start:1205 stop:1468 length:264 start_codon:yes stop_codon:yes gene_type:complete
MDFERDFRNQHVLDLERKLLNYKNDISHQRELIIKLQKDNDKLKHMVYTLRIYLKTLLNKYIFPMKYKKRKENDAVESLINLNNKNN